MKLAIMTKSTFFVEEDKILTTLFDEGMDNLHLYKPGTPPIYSERLLSLISEDYYKKITVHDHFYLKEEYGLYGIHLDTPQTVLPSGYRGRIGRTCTDISELRDMKRLSNYVFLGNIFDSISDPAIKSRFTLTQLEKAAQEGLIDRKVYAMGGMDCDNVRIIKDFGFGGIVIRGDIWKRFDIHNQTDYKELLNHFEKLRNIIN